MISVKELQRQVGRLEADLRESGIADPTTDGELRREWQQAREAQRTAATFEAWREDLITQVAVAWVLGTVFVRFCEDNDLIEYPFIAGPGDRVAVARERQGSFFNEYPELTDRDWICAAFEALSVSPVAAGLFEHHNPMWKILPSHEAAKALLDFWRETDAQGEIVRDLTDLSWDTRFLGDLYQDLSEHAKKTYALLQTPVFVEEFILDYTLDPAIKEFGLEPEPPYGHEDLPRRLRVIDPACGSGHFLLGAFQRILAAWRAQSGDVDNWVLIARALESVHGVDKNPFAVAIARFRLMLAAMKEGNVKRLTSQLRFPLNIAVGDSLLHGHGAPGIQGEFEFPGERHTHTYRTEDIDDYMNSVEMLGNGSYHVVVANPPYITVKDKQENENYRKAYMSCSGKYALSVPFAERIFKLAIHGAREGMAAGYTGQITSNSFMKREFGKKLIEEFFPSVDLTQVIDTSGAYIPGHGTPTVILLGRRRYSRMKTTVRAVLGIRGEPSQPADPAQGLVWQAIAEQIDQPGSESEWVTAVDLARDYFAGHPWSISGGGALDLQEHIEANALRTLDATAESLGITCFTLEDDLYLMPERAALRNGVHREWIREMVLGDDLRDWTEADFDVALFPYDSSFNPVEVTGGLLKVMWPYKTNIANSVLFGRKTKVEGGLRWSEYGRLTVNKFRVPLSIAFAFMATHNHFVLDRGGKVFKQTAPVIKLFQGADEDDHLALLGVLNSSAACFWLKQVGYPKGGDPLGDEGARVSAESWSDRYEFAGTRLHQFPLPPTLPLTSGRELDRLAQESAAFEPLAVCADDVPVRDRLDGAKAEREQLRGRMIALQEELDWDVYHRYGLLSDAEATGLVAEPGSVPELRLGERSFEIVLARRMARGEVETQWFARHGSTPITEIPEHWPSAYREVVERRIEVIEQRRDIALIERPECKRRWQSEPWEKKEQAALRTWLLDRCEERALWYAPDGRGGEQPRPMTVNRLADRLREDTDLVSVARLYAGPDADLADVLRQIVADEHVAFWACYRYTGTGLLKRVQWERTWDLQREEDRTGKRLDIPVPPKYKKEDFVRPSFWNQRGKLDVPKERFISYPKASPDSDDSLLLGWAGWDHREQAHALIMLIEERAATDGWDKERLTPLLAGLAEVMPWVRQWHGEVDPSFGASPAQEYDAYLTSQREKYGLTEDDLTRCAPQPVSRGRGRRPSNG
jgi:hypothetical protein